MCVRYRATPFVYIFKEPIGIEELAVINAQIKKWLFGTNHPYSEFPPAWMLQLQATVRPRINDIITHVSKTLPSVKSVLHPRAVPVLTKKT
ncbi:hypothetical protein QQ045_031702 [Rhodiola kirilowii]